jgi:hypothetical protein
MIHSNAQVTPQNSLTSEVRQPTNPMIDQISELAADGQQQFQELAVDLAEFNNKASQYISTIEHQRDELLDMVAQFELKHSAKLGSEFKVFTCTDWSDLRKIDLSKIAGSLGQNLQRVEDQTRQIEVQKEASIKALLLYFEEQLKSLKLVCPSYSSIQIKDEAVERQKILSSLQRSPLYGFHIAGEQKCVVPTDDCVSKMSLYQLRTLRVASLDWNCYDHGILRTLSMRLSDGSESKNALAQGKMIHVFSEQENINKVMIYFNDCYKNCIVGFSFHSENSILVTLG